MLIDNRLPLWYIFKKVYIDFFFVLIFGLLVHFVATTFKHLLPDLSLALPAFLGTSISILLSFKMNQSYDRWWEARKIWGAIVNDSRSIVRQLLTLVDQKEKKIVIRMAHRQIAWCYCLGQSLRNLDAMANMDKFLDEKDRAMIQKHANKPLALIQQQGKDLNLLRSKNAMDVFTHIHIDKHLNNFCDHQGKAERIKTTIFPTTYRMFLHGIIYLFVITFSISLKDIDTLYELPMLLSISLCFFLIEKSAFHLQDPFKNRPSDTSVTAIARTIEVNIRQLLEEENVPEMLRPTKFYIM